MAHEKKLMHFTFWSAGCYLLRAEGFSCSLDVLYGCLGISILQYFVKKRWIFVSCIFSSIFWSSKPWIRIRIHWIQIHNTASPPPRPTPVSPSLSTLSSTPYFPLLSSRSPPSLPVLPWRLSSRPDPWISLHPPSSHAISSADFRSLHRNILYGICCKCIVDTVLIVVRKPDSYIL